MIINRIIHFIKIFNRESVFEYGVPFTLKSALADLGINGYFEITYPVLNIKANVKASLGWKRIERGKWEINCFKIFSKIIEPDMIIFDVEAYRGTYTLFFSKITHETGKVFSFEPDPKAFKILNERVIRNKLSNCKLESLALGNYEGKAVLWAEQFGKSISSIQIQNNKQKMKNISINITTVDKYCEKYGLEPNLIKIDAEGAEDLIIDGCKNTIKNLSPYILIEFHDFDLSDIEKEIKWNKIINHSKKITYVDGDSKKYQYGDEVISYPDCDRFHVLIKY